MDLLFLNIAIFSLPIPTFAFVIEPLPKISQTHNLWFYSNKYELTNLYFITIDTMLQFLSRQKETTKLFWAQQMAIRPISTFALYCNHKLQHYFLIRQLPGIKLLEKNTASHKTSSQKSHFYHTASSGCPVWKLFFFFFSF